MICPNCFKNIIDDKTIFCSNCGAEVHLDHIKETFIQITPNSDVKAQFEPLKLNNESIKLFEKLTQKINELQDIPQLIKINSVETEFKEIRLEKIKNQYSELKSRLERQKNKIKNDDKKKEVESDNLQPTLDSLEKEIHELETEISSLKTKRSNLIELNKQLNNCNNSLEKLVNKIVISTKNPNINNILMKRNTIEQRISIQEEKHENNKKILDYLDSILSKLNIIQDKIKAYLRFSKPGQFGIPPEMNAVQESINLINSNLVLIEKINPEFNLIEFLKNNLNYQLYYTLESLDFIETSIIEVKDTIKSIQYQTDNVKSNLNYLKDDFNTINQSLLQEVTKIFENSIYKTNKKEGNSPSY